MILLEEWNNSAIMLVMAIFFIPAFLLFFASLHILKMFPGSRAFIDRIKISSKILYVLLLITVFVMCFALVAAFINFVINN